MKLFFEVKNRLNYFDILIQLFRNMTEGHCPVLYQEFLPLVTVLVECLHSFHSQHIYGSVETLDLEFGENYRLGKIFHDLSDREKTVTAKVICYVEN